MALSTQDVSIHMIERGQGAPTLFLHGAPDSGEMWSGVIERLQDHYHCYAPDLPGFGRSGVPADFQASLDYMATFVERVIERYGIATPLNLVVMDFGATYGLAWAASHPQQVAHLAIAGGSNFSSRYQWHGTARILRTPVLGELMMSAVSLSAQERMMRQNAPLVSPEYVRSAYELSLSKPQTRRMMLKLYRSIDPKDFVGWEDRLRELTARVPTLILWGDEDPFITPDYAESFGTSNVEHFPRNGHWLPLEIPEIVARRLGDFFAAYGDSWR
ncbi:alpha/beta fold hydrolase [Dictyobacter aurantiacus]|uniref:Hydrolase n=1 Tax=Dictyobacter aurantiacus TaxID=1936993 RepID=A0A401ZJB4_9CHLR|nr:alpha/beta hydrolase [Dictyobacter aurantiacus]GCE06918.1 hydrolase [Dictyobacter aurantiacus]